MLGYWKKKFEFVRIMMLTIREVTDNDIISLAEFLPKGFPYTTKEYWLSLFEVWWDSNPAYGNKFPRGWVLEKNMSIIGFIGNIPVKFLINGEVKIAAASNSWYVVPSDRGIFSLKLFNEYLKQKSASLFLFKQDDELLLKILRKYAFEEYILPPSQKEYVYIIDKKKVLFIFKKFVFHKDMPRLSKLLEYTNRLGFLCLAYLYQKPLFQGAVLTEEDYTSSLCTWCDDSFSHIWDPYLNLYNTTLSRDTETLNWLYFSPGRLFKRVVIQCLRTHDKSLAGYMVFDVKRIKPSEEGTLQLIDICIQENDPKVIDSLLSFAIEIGKQNNTSLLVVWANSPKTEKHFHRTFTMRRTIKHYRHVRFSDSQKMNSDNRNRGNVCLPMIFPPQ
jgi:hypothetical protein